MIAAVGVRTTIVQRLAEITKQPVVRIDGDLSTFKPDISIPECNYYVIACGVLHQKTFLDQSESEIQESLAVNLVGPMRICDEILKRNDEASIVVIGSKSGLKGSFDMTYAAAKAGLHLYVTTKATRGKQRINCVAPGIIRDSGMTERRHDYEEVMKRTNLDSATNIAEIISTLMFTVDINNAVIQS